MKCDKAQEFFSDYIESTLDRPMTVALESHLNGCESCAAEVASLRSMWTVLDKVPQVEPPADFVWKTTTRLQNEFLNRQEAQQAKPLPWWKRLTPIQSFSYAGIAALLVIGIVVPAAMNSQTWGPHLPFISRPAEPTAPRFDVQFAGQGAATVTVVATSDLPKARVWTGYLSAVDEALKGRTYPVTMPQTLQANQSITVPMPAGGAQAMKIQVMSGNDTFEKVLLLPGAPLATAPLTNGDAYFALQQVAARTGQPMLVDGGLGRVTVDLQSLSPQQALQQVLAQTGTEAHPQSNNVVVITKIAK
jgi:hypothetical protein